MASNSGTHQSNVSTHMSNDQQSGPRFGGSPVFSMLPSVVSWNLHVTSMYANDGNFAGNPMSATARDRRGSMWQQPETDEDRPGRDGEHSSSIAIDEHKNTIRLKLNAYQRRKMEVKSATVSAHNTDNMPPGGDDADRMNGMKKDDANGIEAKKTAQDTSEGGEILVEASGQDPPELEFGPLKPLRLKIGHSEPRRLRGKYKRMLEGPVRLKGKTRDASLCHAILCGNLTQTVRAHLTKEEKRIVTFLLSSTFTDTEWERNLLLDDVMPYLQEYSRRRMFEIKLVEMRWGIREDSSAAHKTSEICMAELRRAQQESQGFFYVFLGCQKYGFRPFPATIPEPIYDKLREAAIHAPKALCLNVNGKFQSHRWLLDQHFQIDKNNGGKRLRRSRKTDKAERDESRKHDQESGDDHAQMGGESEDGDEQTDEESGEDDDQMDQDEWEGPSGPVYVLRPSTEFGKEWWPRFERLQQVLRHAARRVWKEMLEAEQEQVRPEDGQSAFQPENSVSKEGGVLRDPASKAYVKRFFISVTEEEFSRGLLWVGEQNQREKTLVFRRTFKDLRENCHDPKAKLFIDVKWENDKPTIDTEAVQMLEEQLGMTPNHVKTFTYPELQWASEQGLAPEHSVAHKEYLRTFLDDFCDAMMASVHAAAQRLALEPDPIVDEVTSHVRLAMRRAEEFQSTSSTSDAEQITTSYLYSAASDCDRANGAHANAEMPLVIYGSSGSGKTTLISKLVCTVMETLGQKGVCGDHQCRVPDRFSNCGGVLLVRFLGTTPSSSSVFSLLTSLCIQMKRAYQKPAHLKIPEKYSELEVFFREAIATWPSEDNSLTVFLDSVDQLDDSNAGRRLLWLPKDQLPPFVRIIVSTLPDNPIFQCCSILKNAVGEQNMVKIRPFTQHRRVLRVMLKNRNRKLTREQIDAIATCFETEDTNETSRTPLWLAVAADSVSSWTSYDKLRFFPVAIKADIHSLIVARFESLCKIHGEKLIRACFAFVTIANYGVSETELNHLCSLDDEVLNDVYQWWVPPIRTLPPLLITRVLTDCRQYLTYRGDGSSMQLVRWQHRQFRDAALQWLFPFGEKDSTKRSRHLQMADYFDGKWANQNKEYSESLSECVQRKQFFPGEISADRMVPEQPIALHGSIWTDDDSQLQLNIRRLNEHLFHLIHAREPERAWAELQSPEYLAAKFRMHDGASVMKEFNLAIKSFPQISEHLRKCRDTIGTGYQDLSKLPATYLLQLCCQQPDEHPLFLAAQPMAAPEPGQETECIPLIFNWVNKPRTFDSCMMVLRDHTLSVTSVVFARDGSWFLSTSKDQSIRIYDGVSSELKILLPRRPEVVQNAAISNNQGRFATAGFTGVVRVLDSKSGFETCELTELEGSVVNAIGFSCDGRRLAAAGEEGEVVIWKREGEGKFEIWEHEGSCKSDNPKIISSLAWHPKDPFILSAAEGGQAARKTDALQQESETRFPADEAGSEDRSDFVVGGRSTRVWNVTTFKLKTVLRGHDGANDCLCYMNSDLPCPIDGHRGDVLSVSWSPKGDRIATASYDCTVRLWDADQVPFATPIWCSQKCPMGINCLAVSPDGLRVASGGDDDNISLWNMANGELMAVLQGHDAWIYSVSWSADSCVLASGSRDRSVRLWDVTTDESLSHSVALHDQMQRQDAIEQGLHVEDQEENVNDEGTPNQAWALPQGNILNAVSEFKSYMKGKISFVKQELQEVVEDVGEAIAKKAHDALGDDLSELAQEKFNIAKSMAKQTATAMENMMDDVLDFMKDPAGNSQDEDIQGQGNEDIDSMHSRSFSKRSKSAKWEAHREALRDQRFTEINRHTKPVTSIDIVRLANNELAVLSRDEREKTILWDIEDCKAIPHESFETLPNTEGRLPLLKQRHRLGNYFLQVCDQDLLYLTFRPTMKGQSSLPPENQDDEEFMESSEHESLQDAVAFFRSPSPILCLACNDEDDLIFAAGCQNGNVILCSLLNNDAFLAKTPSRPQTASSNITLSASGNINSPLAPVLSRPSTSLTVASRPRSSISKMFESLSCRRPWRRERSKIKEAETTKGASQSPSTYEYEAFDEDGASGGKLEGLMSEDPVITEIEWTGGLSLPMYITNQDGHLSRPVTRSFSRPETTESSARNLSALYSNDTREENQTGLVKDQLWLHRCSLCYFRDSLSGEQMECSPGKTLGNAQVPSILVEQVQTTSSTNSNKPSVVKRSQFWNISALSTLQIKHKLAKLGAEMRQEKEQTRSETSRHDIPHSVVSTTGSGAAGSETKDPNGEGSRRDLQPTRNEIRESITATTSTADYLHKRRIHFKQRLDASYSSSGTASSYQPTRDSGRRLHTTWQTANMEDRFLGAQKKPLVPRVNLRGPDVMVRNAALGNTLRLLVMSRLRPRPQTVPMSLETASE